MGSIHIIGNIEELSALFDEKEILHNGICVNVTTKKASLVLSKYIQRKLIFQELSFIPKTEVFSSAIVKAKPIQIILASSKKIDIEGYINFRLQDERQKIKAMVSKLVTSCQAELRCQEIIGSLRDYVLENSSRETVVQIIPRKNQTYTILDSFNNDITLKSVVNFSKQAILDNCINYDDMLFNTLLDLLPQMVVVHGYEHVSNRNIFDTITKLFKVQIV